MSKHLQRDLESLERKVLAQSAIVEKMIHKASRALREMRPELVAEIMDRERLVDEQEILIEEDCLKILALHQPVAVDLRRTATILKVNNDLERMADQAINIADRVRALMGKKPLEANVDFAAMGAVARRMVHMSVEALVDQDVDIARRVGEMDDELDDMHANTYEIVEAAMAQDPEIIQTAVSYLTISSNLERIGDLSTNIAEETVFMEEGDVVRHTGEM